MPNRQTYDIIIIGAGSAGCTLAGRLTEDPDMRVLLLEAGGWDRDPRIHIPLAWPRLLMKRKHDWMYFTEPENSLGGRTLECARGKVIGGSSSIGAMAYVRGHRGDYERWAANGLAGWSFAHVLPYFRRQESWEGGPTFYRGGDGPLATRVSRFRDPLVEAFAAAGRAAGYQATQDYNGAQQEGFGARQATVRDGRRCSAAVAYLRPALNRRNLTVEVNALATRLIFDGARAVGVQYERNGHAVVARAEHEVVLCGGVINSPQLLMLSGIGDPDALRACGIAVKAALCGVGRNLQDHISASIAYRRRGTGALHRSMRLDRIVPTLAAAWWRREGIAADLPAGHMAFLKSTPETALPDVQLSFDAAPLTAMPYLRPFRSPYADGYACRAVVLRPESRGRLELVSDDPRTPVRIHQNVLAADNDWKVLRAGLRIARDVCGAAPMAPFMAGELAPGERVLADVDLDDYIRRTAITVHHPVGTCKMGLAVDRMAVVDAELRVFGIDGLRVVDGSVMPDLVGGNINAAIVMIAEKAADFIAGRPPFDAVRLPGTAEFTRQSGHA